MRLDTKTLARGGIPFHQPMAGITLWHLGDRDGVTARLSRCSMCPFLWQPWLAQTCIITFFFFSQIPEL